MSITRLQQARQMYAMGQRVSRAFGGVMGMDGRRQYGGGSDMGASGGYGYQGGGTNTAGVAGTGPASSGYGGGNTPSNDGPDNSPNIHTDPTYSPPTTNIVDEVALTGFGKVPGVDYSAVSPGSQFAKNTYLSNNFPEYSFNSKIPSLNFIGNTLGKIGYDVNTNFFKKNSIGGKINPATGKPFGYGIDGYKAYMKQRSLGNVGAYGGTELSQNAINARAAQGDSTQGVMNIDVNDVTDNTTDDDTNEDGSLILRFLHDNPEEVVNLQAMGVKDTDEMLQVMLDRAKNLYTT
jgi:hypothetical protein